MYILLESIAIKIVKVASVCIYVSYICQQPHRLVSGPVKYKLKKNVAQSKVVAAAILLLVYFCY